MGTIPISSAAAFATGLKAAVQSVFVYVIFGTFIGYGALCHDLDFSLPWAVASTVLIWAGPAQVIVVTALGSGVPVGEAAIAVTLSGLRLLPMVAALLPLIKTPATRFWHLLLPAHLTSVSMWVEVYGSRPNCHASAGLRSAMGLASAWWWRRSRPQYSDLFWRSACRRCSVRRSCF